MPAVTGIVLTVFLFCGASGTQGCNTNNQSYSIGPTKGQVTAAVVGVAAVIAVGTVVLVEVHKSHHRVKGCVSAGPGGIEVTTVGDTPRTYLLEGEVATVKAGDLVQFRGNKVKKTKDSTGEQTFLVQKINRDYGPCKVKPVG